MFPDVALALVQLLEPILLNAERRTSFPAHIQVLTCLRLYATGSYQKVISEIYTHPTSQTTVHRFLESVTNALEVLAPRIIQFPTTPQKRQQVQARLDIYFFMTIIIL